MKKKWYPAVLSVLLAGTMLAGCGTSGSNDAQGSTNGQTAKEKIKLTMWGAVPAEAGPQAVIDNWNKDHPDIQVEYIRNVNDDAGNLKLDTALMTNQNIDLFMNYDLAHLQKRMDAGVALDLSTKTDYDIDSQIGEDAAMWKINDKYYGIPTKKNMAFVWLNKDMLDAAGLPIPAVDWTWSDLEEYAKKLTKPGVYGLLQADSSFSTTMDGTLAGMGVKQADGTSNFGNDLWKEHLEILHNMMFVDKSTPEYGEQLTSKMPVDTMFLQGKAAMLAAGEFIFRNANNLKDYPHDFKTAFAAIPKVNKDQKDYKYSGGVGDMLALNAKSKNLDAAWEFAKWYADGGMLPMASGGRIPASKSVDSKEAMSLLMKGVEDKYDTDSMNKIVFGKFPSFQLNVTQQAIDARKEEYEKYFLNKQDIETTMKNMQTRSQELLK
ncbi:extracellular solute-binding protein [Acinetobacter sp. CUI P1]|nr:extracellular solute-binding protein [Acinetobacter sp. CUI P1]